MKQRVLSGLGYWNGNQTLKPGTEITLAVVKETLAAQGMTEDDVREGDVVLVGSGIPLQESMHLADLADAAAADMVAGKPGRDAYTFADILVPVPIQGASGSPGTPMAVK